MRSFFDQEQLSLTPQYEEGVKGLITTQLLVCEFTNGGVTYQDLENMTVPERRILVSALIDLIQQRKEGSLKDIYSDTPGGYYAG